MKKFKYITYAAFAALAISSCTDDILPVKGKQTEPERTVSDYSISPEQALANLDAFMEGDEELTRSHGEVSVKNIFPVKYSTVATRAEKSENECDNLIYVANFEDNAGYALLAADERIPDKVIAVTEEGNLDQETVNRIAGIGTSNKPLYPEYPAKGPGIFSVKKYGDEKFINPNTINQYYEDVDDYLIGNYEGLRYQVGTVGGNPGIGTLGAEDIPVGMCMAYAASSIPGRPDPTPDPNPNPNPPGDDDPIPDPDGDVPGSLKIEYSSWQVIENVSPLLSRYSWWHQEPPFNIRYEKKHKYVFGSLFTPYAGCFPLSVAKIFTHFRLPNISYNHENVNYADLQSFSTNPEFNKSASLLLLLISQGCCCLYFTEGTFTFPCSVTSYMRSRGYKNAGSTDYDFYKVRTMLKNGAPLIIYGYPDNILTGIKSCHAWNIDGYKIKQRNAFKYKYHADNTKEVVNSWIEKTEMVHCDFGWRGKRNGYYVTGVFDMTDDNVEFDPGCDYGNEHYYKFWLKIVTYTKP